MSRAVLTAAVTLILIAGLTAAPETDAEKLVQQLGDTRFRTRAAAEQKLVALGRQAVSALQAALTSGDLEVRLRAERALNAIKTSPEYLVDELRSESPSTRTAAIEGLRVLGDKAKPVIPTLLKMLKEKDDVLRGMAGAALTAIDPENKVLENEVVPAKAHVNGNYSQLLRKLLAPQDRAVYGEFHEDGLYPPRTYWAGYKDIPRGYWVYVYPHWYIWDEVKTLPPHLRPRRPSSVYR